eukprot:9476946-Pyramimonas_sp.AAC.1
MASQKVQANLSEAFASTAKRGPSASPVKEKLEQVQRLKESLTSPPPGASSQGGPTQSPNLEVLEAIHALSENMDNMALKSDVEDMKKDLQAQIKLSVSVAVDPLKSD